MAIGKGPAKGGSGGKRGHSGMEHWDKTEAIKTACRVRRRQEDAQRTKEGVDEHVSASRSTAKQR